MSPTLRLLGLAAVLLCTLALGRAGAAEIKVLSAGAVRSVMEALLPRFGEYPGARSVIRVEVDRVSTSCGYGVPLLSYEGERDQLLQFAERRGPDGLVEYREEKNAVSIDGLPGLGAADS